MIYYILKYQDLIFQFKLKKELIYKSDKIKGTPAYLAPEVYLNKEYSKASDVYSFSLVMYEILSGNPAYEGKNSPLDIKEFICSQNKRPTFTTPINETYRNMIERCWSKETTSRPTFDEILQELRTNPNFITDEIDKEKYQEYIKYIDEYPVAFDPTKKIIHFDYKYKSDYSKCLKNENKINFRSIYDTESDNVLLNYDFIDKNKFKKEKLIHFDKQNEQKIYKISDKETGLFYSATTIKQKIDEIYIRKKLNLYKQVNCHLELKHPSIIKFIGYSPVDFKKRPFPVIVTDYAANGSLESVLELDMKNTSERILNETKRLIIIYGIASGLLYLHSNNIIHSNISAKNIYLDEFLFPKISGFNEIFDLTSNPIPDILHDSFGSIFYEEDMLKPPEYFLFNRISSASDVYAFSMILYELVTNEKPFEKVNIKTIKKVCEQNIRPIIKESVPKCYRDLIEKCWRRDPKERPTFDEIIYILKTDSGFITEKTNKEEFQNYIKFIDEYQSSNNFLISNNHAFEKVHIDFSKRRNPSKLNFSVNMGSVNLENYQKTEKIGSGSFGVVYKAVEKESQTVYAVKISIYEMDQCGDDSIINLSREIDIISRLKHPSILKFVGFNPRNFKNKPKPVIITEYVSSGSLDKMIENERLGIGNHDWNDTKKLINIYGIASGMAYLHNLNILHRDLKPGNILLDELLYPKIADFGLSKTLYEEDIIELSKKKPLTSGFKGTYAYCSPEIMRKQEYSKAGDVYAFAMIVYEILTNEFPFNGLNQYQLLMKIENGYRPPFKYTIPYCYRKLIEKCWSEETYERPDFDKIVSLLENDPNFITQNVDEEEYRDYIFYVKENQQECIIPNESRTNNNNNNTKNHISEGNKINEKVENEYNDLFLDLSKFERKEIVYKGDFSKLYKFIEIETGNIYIGQMSMLKIDQISNEEIKKLSIELNIISKLIHPSLLKFIGYSPIDFKKQRKPVIVTEFPQNNSLESVIQLERMNDIIDGWNDTKKLINIYGIASGMLYLHSNGIIHKSLKPSSIYLDEFLTPKIGDFGLSTRFYSSDSITVQSISGVKGTPIYSAPEVLLNNEYSKSSDVYSFAFIVYEIITNEVPFNEISNSNQIFEEVAIENNRPKFKKEIPEIYKKLIEICWSQNPNERPDFNEIVNILKTDQGFNTSQIEYENYQLYINFIDEQIKANNEKNKTEEKKIKEDENETEALKKYEIETMNKNENEFVPFEKNLKNNITQEYLAKKYIKENDTENIYRCFCILIKNGKFRIPIEYAVQLYKMKCYKKAFNYFTLISKANHPIALYFIGVMKFMGQGCVENKEEAYKILKCLSNNGIDMASDFLDNYEYN